jgi:hypothetical protein
MAGRACLSARVADITVRLSAIPAAQVADPVSAKGRPRQAPRRPWCGAGLTDYQHYG